MKKHFYTFFALLFIAQLVWAEVDSSVSLQTYYATANSKSDNALRLALHDIIKGHTNVTYGGLATLMQWSDTKNADGKTVVDIYTNCTYTCNGALKWISSGNVGDGMNREHTVPQSWFNKQDPMVADAFHIYPTDAKANNNRSSFLYGEFSGKGTSYSTNKCSESGKKGWAASIIFVPCSTSTDLPSISTCNIYRVTKFNLYNQNQRCCGGCCFSIHSSNSCRKCLVNPRTGKTAASANAHTVRPDILPQMDCNKSKSSFLPLPSAMR